MFQPERVIFEKEAHNYIIGKKIKDYFSSTTTEWIEINNNRIKSYIPGEDLEQQYQSGKKTLVVGIKKSLKFQTCKPSANYQLPLVSGCMGQCEYCYLNTQLGDKPFIRVYVNVEEILSQAAKYTKERLPEHTIFEGAATSDPVPVEPFTGALEQCITYFANQSHSRFRFVTKYTDVDSLLTLQHNNHTEIRFSINTQTVIKNYEHHTSSAKKRIEAAAKVAEAGYPIGLLIAPIFYYENWKEEYMQVLLDLKEQLPKKLSHPLTFEIITHRYTIKAKNTINQIFPQNTLPMQEEERVFKYGQFGYGKYVYPKEFMEEVKQFFTREIESRFQNAVIKYII